MEISKNRSFFNPKRKYFNIFKKQTIANEVLCVKL